MTNEEETDSSPVSIQTLALRLNGNRALLVFDVGVVVMVGGVCCCVTELLHRHTVLDCKHTTINRHMYQARNNSRQNPTFYIKITDGKYHDIFEHFIGSTLQAK